MEETPSPHLCCHLKSTQYNLAFHIVDRPVTPLLELKDSLCLSLIQFYTEVHEVETADSFQAKIFNEYKDLFDEALGGLPAVYRIKIDKNTTLVIRDQPAGTTCQGRSSKNELDRMVQLKVITPAPEHTEWVSQMVAAKKKNGEIRFCIDPRDLKTALKRLHHPMKTVEDVAFRMANALVFSVTTSHHC